MCPNRAIFRTDRQTWDTNTWVSLTKRTNPFDLHACRFVCHWPQQSRRVLVHGLAVFSTLSLQLASSNDHRLLCTGNTWIQWILAANDVVPNESVNRHNQLFFKILISNYCRISLTWKSKVNASGKNVCICITWYSISCVWTAGFKSPKSTCNPGQKANKASI